MSQASQNLVGSLDEGTAHGAHDAPRMTLREILNEHGDFVWRSLRRLGVPERSVDDATQQVFLTAARKLAVIVPGRERSFLFGIAMRTALHAQRGLARAREAPLESPESLVDDRPSPEELLDRARARSLLDEVLDAMELDLRAVFVLYELEELTLASIAELLELPQGTATSRLRRAREEFHAIAKRVRTRRARLSGETP